jgi:chaperonin GroEL
MSATELAFSIDARTRMMRGIDILADAVGVTMGPRGRTVVLERRFGAPRATKDGVTVANEIQLADPFENLGARLVREVAERTHREAGDGTTTAIMLARSLAREGCNAAALGLDPMQMRRHVDQAVVLVLAQVRASARPVTGYAERIAIALVASNGDAEVAGMLAEAFAKAGTDAAIGIEESQGLASEIELVDGMRIDQGLLSMHFATDPERMRCELVRPRVLLCGRKLSNIQELLPLLEAVAKVGDSLLIVAEDLGADVLSVLTTNSLHGKLKVAAIKAPAFGEQRAALLDDLGALLGTSVIRDELGVSLEHLTLDQLGRARHARMSKTESVLIGEANAASSISERTGWLRLEIASASSEAEKEKLVSRLAALSGASAIIRIGGATESEIKERKDRADDALHAMRGALADGVVPGGGVALLRAGTVLEGYDAATPEARAAVRAVRTALAAPIRQLAENGGYAGSFVEWKIGNLDPSVGFDVVTGECRDMLAAGIIDPVRSVCAALSSAASISSLLMTTEAAITHLVDAENAHEPLPTVV